MTQQGLCWCVATSFSGADEDRFSLFHEVRHAFLLVNQGEGRVLAAALEQQAFMQAGVDRAIRRFLDHHVDGQRETGDGCGDGLVRAGDDHATDVGAASKPSRPARISRFSHHGPVPVELDEPWLAAGSDDDLLATHFEASSRGDAMPCALFSAGAGTAGWGGATVLPALPFGAMAGAPSFLFFG